MSNKTIDEFMTFFTSLGFMFSPLRRLGAISGYGRWPPRWNGSRNCSTRPCICGQSAGRPMARPM